MSRKTPVAHSDLEKIRLDLLLYPNDNEKYQKELTALTAALKQDREDDNALREDWAKLMKLSSRTEPEKEEQSLMQNKKGRNHAAHLASFEEFTKKRDEEFLREFELQNKYTQQNIEHRNTYTNQIQQLIKDEKNIQDDIKKLEVSHLAAKAANSHALQECTNQQKKCLSMMETQRLIDTGVKSFHNNFVNTETKRGILHNHGDTVASSNIHENQYRQSRDKHLLQLDKAQNAQLLDLQAAHDKQNQEFHDAHDKIGEEYRRNKQINDEFAKGEVIRQQQNVRHAPARR